MKFVFYPQSLLPFHANSLKERPLGGTETGVIRLSKALHDLGHKVVVFTADQDPPESEPRYYHLSKANGLTPVDVFVCIREWIPLVYQIPTKKKFLWTGDAPDQVHNFGVGDKRVAALLDGILTVSDWQSKALSEASGFPLEKCFAMKNGIHLPYFEDDLPLKNNHLIYASTPFRGLEHLPVLFPKIREQVPDAELHIYSGFDVYKGKAQWSPQIQERYQKHFEALKNIPGVTLHGNVNQVELANALKKAKVLCYPNTFKETSCIVVMEALAAGCTPITTSLGALPETVGDCGVLIEGAPGTEEYNSKFVTEIVKLLKDSTHRNGFAAKGRARAKAELDWMKVAERFVKYLHDKHNLK